MVTLAAPAAAQTAPDTTGATASGTINRRDFGLLYNRLLETGGAVVGDEVKMTIDVEATRPAAASSPQ